MRRWLSFLGRWLVIFLVASVLIFGLVRLMPVSPVDRWLSAFNLPYTEENVAYVTRRMGLDRPLIVQYADWILNFLKGDWGYSLKSHLDIRQQFLAKLPYSISIGIAGIVISAFAAFFIGYRAAVRRGGICDRVSAALSVLTQSVPSFIVSIVLIYFFSVRLKLVRFFTGNGAYAMTAAILITALYAVGPLSRVVRKAFREEMRSSYVRFSVSRGFSPDQVLFFHASNPVICRLISTVMAEFATVFGGSSVLEFAFGIPGISTFLVTSMKNSDYNVLESYILVVIIWMFFVHLLLNLALQMIDVRRREA
ncbi:MAG: ABC transporter permease [Lachnospiraceae bacterium]|jgi:peptide/nickel transport system permease protein|nr:ABC transporter permease [Lachnospiraceae bacterium]MCH4064081.1 ABC transporter permease [Lachnospiraceae bacterium]MCH4103194.1 ABC transporter permease [Lachnospiraceae bacterium]MCI1309835.1 ABC transporter permease [Lachnospiraceae bacterium]MCI1334242.1 ABC transporter permease [Lachnospiraceae bacterium]